MYTVRMIKEQHFGLAFVRIRFMSVLLVVCLASTLVTPGSAGWTLSVSVYGYDNPNGLDASGGWCDPFHTPCDPYFWFCLRPKDYDQQSDQCPLGAYTKSSRYFSDTNKISFPVPGYIIPGVPNPLVFSGASWTGGFQLVTRIWDYDPIGSDDLIDRVVINAELNAGSGSSVIQQPGSYGSAVVSLQYTVSCDSNFYGSTCDVYCRSRDDDTGHFTCDSFGNKVCLSGYQNATARCTTRDLCGHNSPCQHGGTCTNSGPDTYQCACPPGWTGPQCEVANTDPCDTVLCNDGDTCMGLSCPCPVGFTGPDCTTHIDDCVGVVCQNQGTCVDRIGTYHCHCTVGFSGRLCEIDLDGCDPNPCYNGGSCVNDVDSFHCNCVEGFGGDLCRDNLHSERCLHGGTYISEEDDFKCLCPPGHMGVLCEIMVGTNGTSTIPVQVAVAASSVPGISFQVITVLLALITALIVIIAVGLLCFLRKKRHSRKSKAYDCQMPSGFHIHNPLYNSQSSQANDCQMPSGFHIHNPLYNSQSSQANGNDADNFVSASLHVPSHTADDNDVDGNQPNDEQPPLYCNAVSNSSPPTSSYDCVSTGDAIYSTIAGDDPLPENVNVGHNVKDASMKAAPPGKDPRPLPFIPWSTRFK